MVPQPNSANNGRNPAIFDALRLWEHMFPQDLPINFLCIFVANRETGDYKSTFFYYPKAARQAAEYALENPRGGTTRTSARTY